MRTADKDEHFVSHVYDACYDAFRQTLAEHHPLEAGGQHQVQAVVVDTRQQLQPVATQEPHHFPLPAGQQLQPVEPLQFPPGDALPFQSPFPAADHRQFQQPGEFRAPDNHQFQVVNETRQQPLQHQFQPVPTDSHQFQPQDALPYPAPEFQAPAEAHQLPNLNVRGGPSRRVALAAAAAPVPAEPSKPPSVRKFHKADREKLRRDKLNEQFAELAGVLDPDRPKNDKATILGDSVQTVRELRAEVKRLKSEHDALSEESRDLTQEKSELREEKANLQADTDQLQQQLQQRLQMVVPWMTMDMSGMMAGSSYPYPVPMPAPNGGRPPGNPHGPPGQVQQQQHPLVSPAPYIPAPAPSGAFPMHPALHAYAMFGNRHGDGSSPYMHYPHYPPPVGSHSHVERPYAQYPSPMQPPPGYLLQMQPPQSSAAVTPPFYRPYGPGMPAGQLPTPASEHGRPYEVSHTGPPEADQSTSSQTASQENNEVQTTLQLQTGHSLAPPECSMASQPSEGGGKVQQEAASGGSELSVQKDVCKREENISEASNTTTPLDLSLRTSSAAVAASSQSASSASCDVEGAGESKRPHEEHSQAAAVDTIQNPNPVSLQQ